MNFHLLDWSILLGLLVMLAAVAVYTRRYTRSVADFLAANRCAGRYLLTIAQGMAGVGAISIVAMWEQFYEAGFAALHWAQMLAPLSLILALSGWIIYRFRETRALTLAQFLEMRYSRRFRLFSGALAWVSGVLNYGIFPAVTGRFLIYFLGLPVVTAPVPGTLLELNLTLGGVMAALLGIALVITLNGGQIAVMVTDFLQGQLSNIAFLVLMGLMLWMFPWSMIIETLSRAAPGQSKLNPFDQGQLPDFNPTYFFILAFLQVYNYMVWQGAQAYNSAARNPHEAKMAMILAQFRGGVMFLLVPLMAICAYVLLHAPAYAVEAAATEASLHSIGDPQLAKQMTTTVALVQVLPVGMMGFLGAVMIMAAVSTDDTYLHSWGSIFVQDVLMPWRQLRGRKRLDQQTHLRLLRWSIIGVAIFAWTFSMLFPLKEYIFMYFQATGAIFTGGAGAVLIGGLYWKRGTTIGAWASMIVGSVIAVGGIFLINIVWPYVLPGLKHAYPDVAWLQELPEVFWLNGVQMSFAAAISASLSYVVGSLVSPDPRLDIDRLLHRGRYAVHITEGPDHLAKPVVGLGALGFTSEFTPGDKIIYLLKLGWVAFFFGVFALFTIWNLIIPWSNEAWARWWLVNIWIGGIVGAAATVWFLIGGAFDIKAMFRQLASLQRDASDDGTVMEHLGEAEEEDGAVVTGERIVDQEVAVAPAAGLAEEV